MSDKWLFKKKEVCKYYDHFCKSDEIKNNERNFWKIKENFKKNLFNFKRFYFFFSFHSYFLKIFFIFIIYPKFLFQFLPLFFFGCTTILTTSMFFIIFFLFNYRNKSRNECLFNILFFYSFSKLKFITFLWNFIKYSIFFFF